MNPADDTVASNTQSNDTPAITAPESIDLDAINEAIAESEKAPDQQNSFDVNDISLDNTPTTDSELQAQLANDPDMSLSGGAATSSDDAANNTPINAPEITAQPAAPAEVAGFVDGDIVDEPSDAPAPVETPDYASREIDPVESFNEQDPASTGAETIGSDAPVQTPEKKAAKIAAKKSIDFDSILHSNVAIIGIVVAIVVILVAVLLIATLA